MTKLNLGAGYKRYPGFLNLDSDKNCKPDYLVELDDKNLVLPFEDNSVDYFLAEHILEHIGDGFFRLLQEIYRTGKHGSILEVKVPHPFHETFLADPTHKRPILVETFRLFSKTVNRLEIQRNGTSSTLGLMYDVDFELLDFDYIHDPFYNELKQKLSFPELERIFREANNTTLEIHMKLMIVKE